MPKDDYATLVRISRTGDEASAGSLGLQLLAEQSGGRLLMESKDIPATIAGCMAEMGTYYVLSFDSPPAATTPGEYRSLQVMANRPGVTVRTTTGYYALP